MKQALSARDAGRPDEAERLYRSVLKDNPQDAEAQKGLNKLLKGQRKSTKGSRRRSKPSRKARLAKAGSLPTQETRSPNTVAQPAPQKIREVVSFYKAGKLEKAEKEARKLVKKFPKAPIPFAVLGAALAGQGKIMEAVPCYRNAIKIKPDYIHAHNNLGNALQQLGHHEEAVSCYWRAIKIEPDFAEAHNNLGNALCSLGKHEEAVTSFRECLRIRPDFAEGYNNLGSALSGIGKLDEAVASCQHAVDLNPRLAEAHNNLGGLLNRLGKPAEAVVRYREALNINPEFADAHASLGTALQKMGIHEEAVASFSRAVSLSPGATHNSINAQLVLPIIPQSVSQLAQWRDRHRNGIRILEDIQCELPNPGKKFNSPSFFLAYQDHNNFKTMKALCELFRSAVPVLNFTASHIADWDRSIGRKIRVGFVSEFFWDHTIGKLYQGLIEKLDRKKLELSVIHLPNAKQDNVSNQIDNLADGTIRLSGDLSVQQNSLEGAELDVIFYTDIGMSPETYFLAFSRLAPVQVVSWGHPDTTGLDSMDYFLSASSIEPEDAHSHYSERLVCLNRLPSFYQPSACLPAAPSRSDLGLPGTGTLYGCPQTLFKIHPDFDVVLAKIAQQDPEGYIVLVEGQVESWSELLRARWARDFPVLLDRTLFLPRMAQQQFLALLKQMDVLLDTVHFGSGNTLYEAMMVGTPIVTWPGNYMRGRIVAGAYRQMGITDPPIAETIDDYAELAVALAHDPDRQSELRTALRAAGSKELFCDSKAVEEFETFLQAAVAAARENTMLAEGWSPDSRE